MPKKKQVVDPPTAELAPKDEELDTFSSDALTDLAEALPDDDLAALYAEAHDRIRDAIRGFRELLLVKKAKLLRGESEWECDTPDGKVYVYRKLPDTSLLKFVAEQAKGKAANKETQAKATAVVLQLALPGHSTEVDSYLASLPDEVISKYDYDVKVLESIKKAKENKDA